MNSETNKRKEWLYYGWVIVLVAMISMAFWFGVRTMFSVFLVALVDEFGWGRGETAGVQSLAMIVYIVAAPLAGGLVDRFGPRRVILPGIVLLAAGIALSGSIHRLLHFYLYFGLIAGIGVTFVSLATYTAIIPHWFEKRRGTASGIAASGMGLGMLVLVPFSQGMINMWDWRLTFVVLGIAIGVILLPLNGLLLRHRPQEMGYSGPDGETAAPQVSKEEKNPAVPQAPFVWTVGEAMRTLNFWALMIYPMFSMIGIYIISVHFIGFLAGQGMDRMAAAAAFGLMGIITTLFRILWGFVSDRIGRERAYTLSSLFYCGSFFCLILFEQGGGVWLVYLFVLLFGIGWGASAPLFMASAADLFHGPAIGTIYGMLEGTVGIGGAFGAYVGGYLFDQTGSYVYTFVMAMISGALSCVFIWLAAPRKGALLKKKTMEARQQSSL